MSFLRDIGVVLVLAFAGTVVGLLGCHNLYVEDVQSLHAADQQLLAAYQATDHETAQAHIRAAFCNEESVERRHAAGQIDTMIIVCTVARK